MKLPLTLVPENVRSFMEVGANLMDIVMVIYSEDGKRIDSIHPRCFIVVGNYYGSAIYWVTNGKIVKLEFES